MRYSFLLIALLLFMTPLMGCSSSSLLGGADKSDLTYVRPVGPVFTQKLFLNYRSYVEKHSDADA